MVSGTEKLVEHNMKTSPRLGFHRDRDMPSHGSSLSECIGIVGSQWVVVSEIPLLC
jgi:hypothetical protein